MELESLPKIILRDTPSSFSCERLYTEDLENKK